MPREPTTPPRSPAPNPLFLSTPAHKPTSAQAASFFSEKTEHAREALIQQLSRIPQVETEHFLNKVLPTVFGEQREKVLHNVMQKLQAKIGDHGPALRKKGNTHVWASFSKQPKESAVSEVKTFESLEAVAGDICRAVEACRWPNGSPAQHFTYRNNGNRSPASHHRDDDNRSRPDGYFVHSRSSGIRSGVEWADIGAIGEFKKGDSESDVQDDARKILWGLNTIMREDPRRRSAYGFTIENTTTRLWFCDRTQIVTSTPFDFCEDPQSLVVFFLTAMYADETALGWDPTIVRVPDAERQSRFPIQYDITVHHLHEDGRIEEIVYRTEELISHAGADGIYGRGTRVWTARRKTATGKVDPQSPLVVLKDTWIDVNRDREGWVVNTIRRECRDTFASPEDRAKVENHLLTVLTHGDVYISTNPRQLDVTPALDCYFLKHDDELKFFNLVPALIPSHGPRASTPSTHLSESSYVDHLPRRYVELDPKAHYRIVFQERGVPIHDVESLSQVFSAIYDVAKLLLAINTLGWVHRDISSGNILLCDGRGLLTDFEYAKRWMDDQSPHHKMRTGTQYFMSLEADRHDYLFRPSNRQRRQKVRTGEEENASSLFGYLDATPNRTRPSRGRKSKLSYRYHPLNEWESLFWLLMYITLDRVVEPGQGSPHQPKSKLEVQRQLARALFYNFGERQLLFTKPISSDFDDLLDQLEACLHPEVIPVASILSEIREDLFAAYQDVEVDAMKHPNGELSLRLIKDILVSFREIHEKFKKKNIKIKPLPASEA